MSCFIPVATPPSNRRFPQSTSAQFMEDIEPAQMINGKKTRGKMAPAPPKRTSSFRTQQQQMPPDQASSPNSGFLQQQQHLPDLAEGADMDNCLNNPCMTDSRLSDDQLKSSQSSSEDLLSTPASHSRSGSLERILEHRVLSGGSQRSRSSSWDRSLRGDQQKTPETDVSDTSLPPPPPPCLLEEAAQPTPARPLAEATPLSYLRQSLRKTNHAYAKKTSPPEETSNGVGTLDSANVKKAISRYGTIPKGARIGQFLASLEDSGPQQPPAVSPVKDTSPIKTSPSLENKLSDSCSNVSEMVLKMPTPEVRRKVEEWQQGVQESLQQEQGEEEAGAVENLPNLKPSALVRSSSFGMSPSSGAAPSGEQTEKPPLSTFLTRQKSDVTNLKSNKDGGSPLAQRHAKPTPSPRAQPKFKSSTMPVDKASQRTQKQGFTQNVTNTLGSPAKVGGLATARTTSSSSEELLESKSAHSAESLDQDTNESVAKKIPPRPIVAPYTSVRSETPPLRKFNVENNKKKESSAVSRDSSMESTSESPLVIETQKGGSKGKKAKDSGKSSPFKSQGSLRGKLGLFKQSPSDKEDSKSKAKSKDSPPSVGSTAAPAKPALVGAKAVLPSIASVISSPDQLPARSTLHHIKNTEMDKKDALPDSDEPSPVSKETVIALSKHLSKSLEDLNSAASKHSSNFLHLSEEVLSFYDACARYVESLPPHGKFKFQELLNRLERVADGLKTCSSSSSSIYDKLLTDLCNSVLEIDNVLKK